MKEVTQQMIKDYQINKLRYDFMGYTFHTERQLSFHHMIIAKRDCRAQQIPHDGYVAWNGAILVQNSSHDYLHEIEMVDRELFELITQELIQENKLGEINLASLIRIRLFLEKFEKEHKNELKSSGKKLIKERFTRDRIIL